MSYSIGIDFGTASGRVILADTSNGHIISRYEEDYANGTYMNSLYDKPLPETTSYKMLTTIYKFLNKAFNLY